MSLRVTSVRIANPSRQEFLHTTLREIPTPPGEPWLARLSEDVSTGVWELMVAGPAHTGECDGWEVSRTLDERLRFRALLRNRNEQSADVVRRRVRRLAWNGVRISLTGTVARDPQVTQAFEDAAWAVLLAEHVTSLDVRLGFWSPGAGEVHCYCEVEAPPLSGEGHARHVWCPLVRTPAALSSLLAAAVCELRGDSEPVLEGLLEAPPCGDLAWPKDEGSHPLESLLRAASGEDHSLEATHWA